MACNCKNGTDQPDFLTPVPGGTPANATYQLGLTHYTCGCRKMLLADPTHPVIAELTVTPIGTPIDLGNDTFCQECVIAGTVTYCPCNSCSPRVEYVSHRECLPCSSDAVPTITVGTVAASPKPIKVYVNNGPKLRAYDSNWTAPFFVNARGNFMAQEDRGFSPYWSMNVGYVVKDGFFMSPTLGIRYGAMRSDFLLGISYSLNRIDNWPTVDKFTHSLMLTLGYEY